MPLVSSPTCLQVLETPTWSQQTVCPAGGLAPGIPLVDVTALNTTLGPLSSLPSSPSPTFAPLWVSGWRATVTDGVLTTAAVTLLPAGGSANQLPRFGVDEYRLRTYLGGLPCAH
jgi:hypothetical protein